MKIQNKKTKTVTTIVSALVIGLIMLSPTTVMPNVNAQTANHLPPGKEWAAPPVTTSNPSKIEVLNNMALKKAGYIATPIGFLPPECVREDGNNAHIYEDGSVDLANGTHLPPLHCNYHIPSGSTAPSNAWVEDASTCYCPTTPPAIQKLSGAWTVPPAPTSNDGQTIYLWIGLQPTANNTAPLIQPVLEWGQGSANYWQIASWYCSTTSNSSCQSSTSVYSTSAGKTITGTLTGSSCSSSTGVCGSWNIQTTDGTNVSTLTYSGSTALYWLDGAVLEEWNVIQCSDYPAEHTTGTPFNSFLVTDTSGNSVSPSWTGYKYLNQCNNSVSIVGTQATLYYGN